MIIKVIMKVIIMCLIQIALSNTSNTLNSSILKGLQRTNQLATRSSYGK